MVSTGQGEHDDVSWFDGTWACARAARALCVLAVLAAGTVPLAFAPSALAAEDGQITGTVTDAPTRAPISGIEVCVRNEQVVGGCEFTDGDGGYTIQHIVPGSYTVQFTVVPPARSIMFRRK